MDFTGIGNQIKNHLKDPRVILGRKLWTSAGALANIEMFVFAKLGLSWEEVLIYNPDFNGIRSSLQYDKMIKFVEEDSKKCVVINRKISKVNNLLDEVCDIHKDDPRELKRIE